ncbi:MAG TPA: DUF5011 domain-containing protein [Candidatus Hydrogenedentes bacterium]|nr:DUF5011 domain-containing protein [Candidatus Hydrogenedentota bacterium]HQM47967.1 DUF5011 domain-containing protein [Candidatus Hydrogenedentota bacterium]
MNQYRWPATGEYRVSNWRAIGSILLLAAACFPASAFDESGLPTVSETTAVALKNLSAGATELAVPYASMTIYDITPPAIGTAQSPSYAPPTGVSVSYSGMSDTISGLKTVALWVRANDAGWARTGQTLSAGSGTLSFNPFGVEGSYYFAVRLEDNAGNLSPEPSGIGLTHTRVDGTPPVLTLNGASEITIQTGETYNDPGASATDALEGDLTSRIAVSGSVDTAKSGTYTLRYNVSDTAGNAAPEVTRTVTVEGVARTYALSIPTDLKGRAGYTLPCPVNIADAQGLTAYNLTVSVDTTVLQIVRVAAGTIAGGWGDPVANVGAGSASFSASGAELNSGSGSVAIVYVTVKKNIQNGKTSPLAFSNVQMNNGAAQATTQDGLFTVNNDTYLWGDVNGDGVVDNADSTAILKGRASINKPNPKSADSGEDTVFYAAGDVSGDEPSFVGTVDASLIMRFSEGAISSFPADIDGDGIGPELTGAKTQAKEAVSQEYGDRSSAKRLLSIPGKLKLDPEAVYQVPVSIDSANLVRGYYFELLYDSRALEYLSIQSGSLTGEWLDPIVNPLTGKIMVAGANTDALSGQGTLAILTFRAKPTVTPGAATRLKFDTVELNDGLLTAEQSTGAGEPVIAALEPKTGAETGGTVVQITGANLADVSRVLFGQVESPYVWVDATGSAVFAVTPPGSGKTDVTVESPAGKSTLKKSFTYFRPQVHLTMTPEKAVASSKQVDIPVWMVDLSGGQVSTVAFDLRFDPTVFTPKAVNNLFATAEDSANQANKRVTATLSAPGRLHITVDGSVGRNIESGLLVTCHLLAIASEEEAQGLVYIADTTAENVKAKALPAAASFVSE